MFLVVGLQVCTHLRRDFVPLLFADLLQVIKVSRRTFSNSNLQLPPQIVYGMKVWRLPRPPQDLNVLHPETLLCYLGRVFWVIVMLESYMSTFECQPRETLRAGDGGGLGYTQVHTKLIIINKNKKNNNVTYSCFFYEYYNYIYIYIYMYFFNFLLIKQKHCTAVKHRGTNYITLHCNIHHINIVYSMCCPSEPQLHECTAVI